jgi:Ca2+-binding RTX toxin-like protein
MRLRLTASLPILAAVAAVSVPAAAHAATVSVVTLDSCQGDAACEKASAGSPVAVTTFAARPGEANRVRVSRQGGRFLFTDSGAPLDAKAPCERVATATVRCPVTLGEPGIRGLQVDLGDGGDEVTVVGDPGVETSLTGGAGADVITGGDERDVIDGGPGADLLAGGENYDDLSYERRRAPVSVDLASGTAGEAGEGDRVSGFETVIGGRGDDSLRGAGADEVLDGGPGDDALRGGFGADTLFGNVGADRLEGGAGDDQLFGDPGQGDGVENPIIRLRADRLDGGAGDDMLFDTGGHNVFRGGPGRDYIEGGQDPDRIWAGAGRDIVDAKGGGADAVDCGAGRDRAATDVRRDSRRSCERRYTSTR